jgi:hypothetical protein
MSIRRGPRSRTRSIWAMFVVPLLPVLLSLVVAIGVVAPLGRYIALLGINQMPLERMIALESHTIASDI